MFREGEFTSFVARLRHPRDATATPLADAEVHALRALVFATAGADGASQKVRAEVTEALRLDPLEPRALYLQRTWLHEAVTDVEGPKRLIARHPDDAIAWALLMLARAARHEPQEAAEALEQLRRIQGAPGPAINLDLRLARPD